MRTPPDLHPDDLAIRENLRDILTRTRLNYGMTRVDLAHLFGVTEPAVFRMERDINWRASTVQRWATALRLRLILWPECLPPDDDVYLLRPSDPVAAMTFDRRVWSGALVEARRWAGVTQRRVGERMGITPHTVGEIERLNGRRANFLLINAQRYCRALDSALLVDLEDVNIHD